MVDVMHDFAQTSVMDLEQADVTVLNDTYTSLAQQGHEALVRDGFLAKDRVFVRSAELRYQGQEHTVNLPIVGHDLAVGDLKRIADDFHEAHRKQYGHCMDDPVEIVTLRLRAIGLLPRPILPKVASGTGNAERARKGNRSVYQPILDQQRDYGVYERNLLRGSDRIDGPAIIEEPTSTTVIHAGDVLTVGEYGELVITIGT